MKKKILYIAIPVVLAIVLYFIFSGKSSSSIELSTAVASCGEIVNTVTATGTIEPIDKIDVGTQVSGVIQNLYVDFNSHVKKGQLLAELDKSTLQAKVLQAQASLESAENELTYQTQNFNRIKKLYESQDVSEVDYEQAQYSYNTAKISITRLKSELGQAEVNLSYASIYSPIDGVVLNRDVEAGQTVAASFSTPTLFSIARDLTKMKVEADVDEADIGQVKEGQDVTFTVDAFPADTFMGNVLQVRLNPTVSSNVVTYTVIVEAPNKELKLMPGLTASISIITKKVSNVVVLSSSALQFSPSNEVLSKFMGKPDENRQGPPPSRIGEGEGMQEQPQNVVWVKRDGKIHPQPVKLGMDDGVVYEVVDGLSEGDSVVIGATVVQAQSSNGTQGSKNPFMPQRPQRKGNAGGGPSPR